ncbi:MAG: hypothetical protein RCG15_04745 [Candidatus Rickettsia vulgarisii]
MQEVSHESRLGPADTNFLIIAVPSTKLEVSIYEMEQYDKKSR